MIECGMSFPLMRILKIKITLLRYLLNRQVVGASFSRVRKWTYLNPWSYGHQHRARGVAMREALEYLGPVFVKFGQVLSTRQDLLPPDIAEELAKLQDQVPPFSGELAQKIIEEALQEPIAEIFQDFNPEPLASASVAQVHAAVLKDGRVVVIKVLRPNIEKIIQQDISLLYFLAKKVKYFFRNSERLRLTEVVKEFEETLEGELDLREEAGNAALLRRNFNASPLLYVPWVEWKYIRKNVMVMERVYGVPVSDIQTLRDYSVNLKKLAESGVEIFFTQVFRDGFFHADMHPGNIFVDIQNPENPRYNGVDFGIMGTLSEEDQRYLAEIFLAFFRRDYQAMARWHVISGWVPKHIRVDRFASALRAICEPMFERPFSEISYGQFLMSLFKISERFEMRIQPQLFLLQKTLLNVEGLGRRLYPDLDLWTTAKPFLEKWMREQLSIRRRLKQLIRDFPVISEKVLVELPSLIFAFLRK